VTDHHLRANGHLVDDLGGVARHGGSALADGPALLRRVLEEGAWREFVTQRGDHVKYTRFSEFVQTAPLKGLGADLTLIERIAGTDPDLRLLLRAARARNRGRPVANEIGSDSDPIKSRDDNASKVLAALARDDPQRYEQVRSGELTINAAAVQAGIRPRRISVRPEDPHSTARALRRHMSPESVIQLRELLAADPDEEEPT